MKRRMKSRRLGATKRRASAAALRGSKRCASRARRERPADAIGPVICLRSPRRTLPDPKLHAATQDEHHAQRLGRPAVRPMTRCRMCSQRLPRPGRLCRDCERELDRARLVANTVAGLAPLGPPLPVPAIEALPADAASPARSRAPIIVAMAFALGLAGAAVLLAGQRSTAPAHDASVMLDRDVSDVKPRMFAPPARPATPHAPVAASVARPSPVTAGASTSPPASVAAAPKAAKAPRALDRVLALSDALGQCASETFFARIACEQRARSRYCDGAGELPQCAHNAPRGTGG